MNKFIGLCTATIGWPSPLGSIGYEVQVIEGAVATDSAHKVVPDLIACSQSPAHAVVAECKSGSSLDPAQDKKYGDVKAANIAKVVTVDDEERLTHVVTYVTYDDRYEALRRGTSKPFIVFGKDYVEGRGDFKSEDLGRALQRTTIPDGCTEPTKYYPFSHDEAINVIAPYALKGMLLCIMNEDPDFKFDFGDVAITAILKRTHAYYDRISAKHKRELKKKTKEVLRQIYQTNSDFAAQLHKLQSERPSPAAIRKLNTTCRKIIKDYSEQQRLG